MALVNRYIIWSRAKAFCTPELFLSVLLCVFAPLRETK